MIDESFSPDELVLIERLQNAPQPVLRPAAAEAMRARMLRAMDAPAPSPRLPLSMPVIITIVIVLVAIIIGVILIVSRPPVDESLPPATIITPTPATTPTPIPSPTIITPEATQEVTIVIEGPIETINGNVMTIFGNTVELQPTDPLLATIRIGDVLRVEGNLVSRGEVHVLMAVRVIYVEVEVNVNPQTNDVWRDDGSCNNPPPDWAPAHGWRRRCGQPQPEGQQGDTDDDHDD
jgi:hypothetical protein